MKKRVFRNQNKLKIILTSIIVIIVNYSSCSQVKLDSILNKIDPREILKSKFPDARIVEQVKGQMDGAAFVADFVIVKDNKVLAVIDSKVNGSTLSNGQKLFFQDGDIATFTGKNATAGNLQGVTVNPKITQTGVYKWDSKTGSYVITNTLIR